MAKKFGQNLPNRLLCFFADSFAVIKNAYLVEKKRNPIAHRCKTDAEVPEKVNVEGRTRPISAD
jgi:hypothetical protein